MTTTTPKEEKTRDQLYQELLKETNEFFTMYNEVKRLEQALDFKRSIIDYLRAELNQLEEKEEEVKSKNE